MKHRASGQSDETFRVNRGVSQDEDKCSDLSGNPLFLRDSDVGSYTYVICLSKGLSYRCALAAVSAVRRRASSRRKAD